MHRYGKIFSFLTALSLFLSVGVSVEQDVFPQSFVNDEGSITGRIVLGEDAKVSDVIGGVEIAGSLGQATVKLENRTVSKEYPIPQTFKVDHGFLFDSDRDVMRFGDYTDFERKTVDFEDSDFLVKDSVEGEDEDYEYRTVFHPSSLSKVGFGASDASTPELSLGPAVKGESFYRLSTEFDDSVNLSDVTGSGIQLFGKKFFFSSKGSEISCDELTFFDFSEQVQEEEGSTVVMDDGGFSFNYTDTTVSSGVMLEKDGESFVLEEGGSERFGDRRLVVDEVFYLESDVADSLTTFRLESGRRLVEDDGVVRTGFGGEDVDGAEGSIGCDEGLLESFGVRVERTSDRQAVPRGSRMTDPAFRGFELVFEGLKPFSRDAENGIRVEADGSKLSAVFEHEGSVINQVFVEDGGLGESGTPLVVGEKVSSGEDSVFVLDNGFEGLMVEYTGISEAPEDVGDDSVELEFENVVTDEKFEVDMDIEQSSDYSGDGFVYTGSEVVGSEIFYFGFNSSNENVSIVWGDGAGFSDSETSGTDGVKDVLEYGDSLRAYPGLKTVSDSKIVFTKPLDISETINGTPTTSDFTGDKDVGFTVSDGSATYTNATVFFWDGYENGATDITFDVTYDVGGDVRTERLRIFDDLDFDSFDTPDNVPVEIRNIDVVEADGVVDMEISAEGSGADGDTVIKDIVGPVRRETDISEIGFPGNQDSVIVDTVSLLFNSTGTDSAWRRSEFSAGAFDYEMTESQIYPDGFRDGLGALIIEPEDDEGVENGYGVSFDVDGEDYVLERPVFTDDDLRETATDDDTDRILGFDRYGSFSVFDDDKKEFFELRVPERQSRAVAGVVGEGSGIGSVDRKVFNHSYRAVTNPEVFGGISALGTTDSLLSDSERGTKDLLLVGGPAVNDMVEELSLFNRTWTVEEWQGKRGTALVQFVENGFSRGNDVVIVAGYSAEDTLRASRALASGDFSDVTVLGAD